MSGRFSASSPVIWKNAPSNDVPREELEPRLSCAIRRALNYLLEDERTQVRTTFDQVTYATLSDADKNGIRVLVERLDENWSLTA
jgi:hypothetical protein